ncbi:MAG TPA: carboxypeptidase-like regulatory domain-containing protein [Vicinamibacterales bacterium]|nr:carboxypeptidase-like regulatory domain-containing protein [Vicinamibacterales bacterium]
MRRLCAASLAFVGLLVVPSLVFAQASITGVVKDASGAVLPGVTVEAANPELIEKVRTATTDGDGQYRILDLRAGTYSITFSLAGFTTVKREGIQLSGSFIATINADMKVGALQETVVVTGETPIVDVQSVSRQTTLSNDVINAIPAARSYAGLMTLMPNTVTQSGAASNTQVAPNMVVFGGAGGRSNEGRLQVDGISVGTAFNGAGVSAYVADVNNAQEIVLTASGGLGESEVGGPTLNIVPKEGGNQFSGQLYFSKVTEGMVGDNYDADLQSRGATTPAAFKNLWDYNTAVGGPIKKDRLWFFLNVRNEGYENTVPGMYANLNANDPTKWTYVPDKTRPAYQAAAFQNQALRLTAQVSPKNKVSGLWDEQVPCEGAAFSDDAKGCRHSDAGQIICAGASPTPSCSASVAPEVGTYRHFGQRIQQLRWTSPRTNKLLLQAGFGTYMSRWGGAPMPGQDPNLIRVLDQCTGNVPGTTIPVTSPGQPCEHGIGNLTYRSPNWASNWTVVLNFQASASYVMGAHNMKLGYQGAHMSDNQTNFSNDQFLTYRFNNAVPNQFTQTINQFTRKQRVRTMAYYFQDSYTVGRFTFQGALRYDHAWSYFPAQEIIPVRFFPQGKSFPFTDGSSYNDLTPRGGVAMDVFGNGKTSVKFNFGRYLEAAQNAGFFITNNPIGRLSTSVSRQWTDNNNDKVVDCDLMSQAAQSPTTTGSIDTCGVGSPNFGTEVVASTLDPTLTKGWGVRSGDWQWGASVQQQLLPRMSAEFSYQRRWLLNFSATDNRNVGPADYDSFAVLIPSDARLPGGGGGQLANVLNITSAANARLLDNFVTLADRFGAQTQSTDSLSLNITARPRFGLMVQGGFNYARTNFDSCDIRNALPESNPTNPWCNTTTALLRATGLGSYTLPKVDVQVAATFRSDQGSSLAANYAASQANTTLTRPFAGSSNTVTVNLIEPGTLYGDRVNEFDLRIGKILRFKRTRTNVGVDIYNLFNANPVLTYNETFSPNTTTWLRPNSILQPRFAKISAQINF